MIEPDDYWEVADGVFLGCVGDYRLRMHQDDLDTFKRINLSAAFPERTYRVESVEHTLEVDVIVHSRRGSMF